MVDITENLHNQSIAIDHLKFKAVLQITAIVNALYFKNVTDALNVYRIIKGTTILAKIKRI